MTLTTSSAPKQIDVDALRFLARCPGPFITAIIPDHHPGAPEGSRSSIIHGLAKKAA